jgi:hypothetical protein
MVGILLDDLRRTVAMCHVIGDDVNHPMAGVVDARDFAAVQSDVGIGYVLRHPSRPAHIICVRQPPRQACCGPQ